jgi:NAD(P)-dependent dehydrogenase (short-subunit alcohol dehydrogenase family)
MFLVCVLRDVLHLRTEGTQQAIEAMANNESGGVVINVASMAGLLAMPQSPVYAASKSGVVNFTRSMKGLIGQSNGVRVNAIWCATRSSPFFSSCCGLWLRCGADCPHVPRSPTFTETPLVRENPDEVVEGLKRSIGGRLLTPSDVAQGMVELMVDPKLTGAVMRVTVRGGREILPSSSSSQSSKSPATARL